jgi:hypothetical protein
MTPINHLTVCTSEEAGEVAELAFELGKVSLKLSKDLHKALRFGFTDVDPATGLTKIEMLVNELIDLKACVELLQEAGVPLFGIDNRDKIEAKKRKVLKYMEVAKELGTVTQAVIPITEPKTNFFEYPTLVEKDRVIECLTTIYNPIRQKEFAQQLFDYTVEKIKTQAMPNGVSPQLTEQFSIELTHFKNDVIKSLITGHKYNTEQNKNFLSMVDVQIVPEQTSLTIQPNSVLEVLMHGVAPVNFFIGFDDEEINDLWAKHKHEFQ